MYCQDIHSEYSFTQQYFECILNVSHVERFQNKEVCIYNQFLVVTREEHNFKIKPLLSIRDPYNNLCA